MKYNGATGLVRFLWRCYKLWKYRKRLVKVSKYAQSGSEEVYRRFTAEELEGLYAVDWFYLILFTEDLASFEGKLLRLEQVLSGELLNAELHSNLRENSETGYSSDELFSEIE